MSNVLSNDSSDASQWIGVASNLASALEAYAKGPETHRIPRGLVLAGQQFLQSAKEGFDLVDGQPGTTSIAPMAAISSLQVATDVLRVTSKEGLGVSVLRETVEQFLDLINALASTSATRPRIDQCAKMATFFRELARQGVLKRSHDIRTLELPRMWDEPRSASK